MSECLKQIAIFFKRISWMLLWITLVAVSSSYVKIPNSKISLWKLLSKTFTTSLNHLTSKIALGREGETDFGVVVEKVYSFF